MFSVFIVTPSLVTYFNCSVDVSLAFTANEEENSTKNHIDLKYEEFPSNYKSIHFLQEQDGQGDIHKGDYHDVFLDVISPPPQQYI